MAEAILLMVLVCLMVVRLKSTVPKLDTVQSLQLVRYYRWLEKVSTTSRSLLLRHRKLEVQYSHEVTRLCTANAVNMVDVGASNTETTTGSRTMAAKPQRQLEVWPVDYAFLLLVCS